jgi:hypothetical protein
VRNYDNGQILALHRRFFADHPATRLHPHFEAISGPWERLFGDEADLTVPHVDKSAARIGFIGTRNRRAARFEVDQIMLVFPGSNGNRERISGAIQHRHRERPC